MNVQIDLVNKLITIKGKLGTLTRNISEGLEVAIIKNEKDLNFLKLSAKKKAIWGTETSNFRNIIKGVSQGFKKHLLLVGIGYKCKVIDNCLYLKLGYSHEIKYEIPQDIKVYIPKPDQIILFGINKFQSTIIKSHSAIRP